MSMDASPSAEKDALRRHLSELLSITAYGKDPRELNAHGTGTVLCIVNFPKTDGRDCNNFAGFRFHTRYMVRIPHDRLVATGSPKIMMMLEPTRHQRTRNRYQDVLSGVDGVDYVLDFTPPDNDEAADLMTSLWLPPGTKIWWTAGYYVPSHHLTAGPFGVIRPMADKPVGAVLTLGHDDNCTCHHNGNTIEDLWSTTKNIINVPGIYPGRHVPWYRNIEGYCKIRHCMCTIRILRAIAGEDLLINSATRMWTVAKLAIHLELPNVVRDDITQWFTAQPNSKFIEMFPEESFELALGLKMSDVLIASFKILVNERAVELAAPFRSPDKPRTTWAGRLRESYGDMPEDPVEHAAQAMADRLNATVDRMQSLDNLDILEWNKLKYFGLRINQSAQGVVHGAQTELLDAYNLLVSGVEEVSKRIIREALKVNPVPEHITGDRIKAQRAHSAPVDQLQPLPALYDLLHDNQRVCLPFFWAHLKGGLPEWNLFKYQRHEGCSLDELANHFNGLLDRAVLSHTLKFNHEEVCRLFDEFSPDYSEIYKFNLAFFHEQLKERLNQIASKVLGLPTTWKYIGCAEEKHAIDFLISDHLLTHLDESELRFLPLWAGGNDDGTGGVFQPELPPAVLGATQPGPLYHTRHTDRSDTDGRTAGYTTNTDSSFSDLGMDNLDLDYATTVAGASNEPQYSHDSTIPPNGVMAMSTSIPSETFTENGDVAYAEAMYAQPAEHQPLGQALAACMEDDPDGRGNNDQDGGSVDWDPDSQDGDTDEIDSDSTVSMGDFSHDDDDGDFAML